MRPPPPDQVGHVLAIQMLKARYFHTLDTKDWAQFRDVFTDDLLFWRDSAFGNESSEPVTTGADAFVRSIRARHEHSTTIHHGHDPEIVITGPDSAQGLWSLYDWVDNPEQGHAWHGFGHYSEEYQLCPDGCWRIRRMRLARTRLVPAPVTDLSEIRARNAAWQAGTLRLEQ